MANRQRGSTRVHTRTMQVAFPSGMVDREGNLFTQEALAQMAQNAQLPLPVLLEWSERDVVGKVQKLTPRASGRVEATIDFNSAHYLHGRPVESLTLAPAVQYSIGEAFGDPTLHSLSVVRHDQSHS